MTVITTEVNGQKKEIYIDGHLYNQINKKIIPNFTKKDKDNVFIIDGDEGSGKSVFSFQLAKILDPKFNINDIAFSAEEFENKIRLSEKGKSVVFDEAFRGLSSRGSLTKINKIMVELIIEMRQKNLNVFVNIPSIFILDKYVAIWRAKHLFHVYERNGRRGFWMYFNKKKKKGLYILGKKFFSYAKPKSCFKGRFYEQYAVDEAEYRKRKAEATDNKQKKGNVISAREERYFIQRSILFWILSDNFKLSLKSISELCKKYKMTLSAREIGDCVSDLKNKKFVEMGLMPPNFRRKGVKTSLSNTKQEI